MLRGFFLCLMFLLTSCGFHLRGAVNPSPELKQVYIQTATPYDEITRAIRNSLQLSGVNITSRENARVILAILNVQQSQQQTNVSSTQQTRQFNLNYSITFQLLDVKGNAIITPQSVSETRSLTVQADATLAGSNEAQTLYQQMRPALVFDLMQRLSSKQMTQRINTYFKKPQA
ncbi:MAG: LPS assembly lipoprotein LptE [Gammaproteobacteria bacterium]|nr:LPS assembly lipoprotein LptE [Gammaproteobacteria bacterium]